MLRSIEDMADKLEGIVMRENDVSKGFKRPRPGNPSYVKDATTGTAGFPCFGVLQMDEACARTMETLSGAYGEKWMVYYGNKEVPILTCDGSAVEFKGFSDAHDARLFFQDSDVIGVTSINVRQYVFQINAIGSKFHNEINITFDKKRVNIQ